MWRPTSGFGAPHLPLTGWPVRGCSSVASGDEQPPFAPLGGLWPRAERGSSSKASGVCAGAGAQGPPGATARPERARETGFSGGGVGDPAPDFLHWLSRDKEGPGAGGRRETGVCWLLEAWLSAG